MVISYKGFALGNLYSNLKKIFWAFLLDFSFFGWIISFNLMLLQRVNGSRGVQTGCVLITFQNFVKVFDEYCNNRVIEKLSFTIFKNRIL